MAQWSIGICTPIPMVPVDQGTIVKAKVGEAAQRLEAGDTDGCLQSLQESLTVTDQGKHLGLITPEWQRARSNLAIPPGHAQVEIFADGMEVGVARCSAVQSARDAGLRFLMFIDWDTIVPPDALLKLSYFLDNNPDYDVASGMYVMKTIPTFPLIWKDWNQGVFFDFTLGDVIKEGVVGVPMGCCLLRLSLFDKLTHTPENPWFQTVDKPVLCGGKWGRQMMTEDLWFTMRFTNEVDTEHKRIMVDTSVWCEHIDHATGRRYTLGEDSLPLRRFRENQAQLPKEERVVLHVGCGKASLPKGRFDGYEEVRLDIDPGVEPDVVGSLTEIPLLSGTVDAVYGSHVLEHLSENEIPAALSEAYRVLRTNGLLVLHVPDAESACAAVPRIGLDGHLYTAPCGEITPRDVLFGLQSTVKNGNSHMAHRTAFTQESLKKTLKDARFTSVKVERYPELYELVATAERP